MKLKVIGWDSYDFSALEEGEDGWSATQAVFDEIKNNKLFFSGKDHQERDGCAPVLNDGKIRRFSQRGFAGLMAEANGYTPYDYPVFMFSIREEAKVFPKNRISAGDLKDYVAPPLNEKFSIEVDEATFSKAEKENKITLLDLEELKYIDAGDKLELKLGEARKTYDVVRVDRNLGDNPKISELEYKMRGERDDEKRMEMKKKLCSYPVYLILFLSF